MVCYQENLILNITSKMSHLKTVCEYFSCRLKKEMLTNLYFPNFKFFSDYNGFGCHEIALRHPLFP